MSQRETLVQVLADAHAKDYVLFCTDLHAESGS